MCLQKEKKGGVNKVYIYILWQRSLAWLGGTHSVASRKSRAAAGSCMAGGESARGGGGGGGGECV